MELCAEVSSAKPEERPKATILSRLQDLPSDDDIPGAVGKFFSRACGFNGHCSMTTESLVFCCVSLISACHLYAGPSANGTARLDLGNGMHASVDTSFPLGQRFVPPSPATTSGRELQGRQHTTAWAVRGGIKDLAGEFERLRPSMAHHFPFELDTFQKEAVVHLEKVRFSRA